MLVAAGLCEAMTRSVVGESLAAVPSPWGHTPPLAISPPLVRGADRLRQSLLPSLLEARAGNEAVGVADAELFEIARGYLARPAGTAAAHPAEEPLLASFVVGGDFARAKGLVDAVLAGLRIAGTALRLVYRPIALEPFAVGRAAEVVLERAGQPPVRVAVVGEVAKDAAGRLGLHAAVAAAEIRLDELEFAAAIERSLVKPSDFPAVQRDINLVVDERVPWGDVASAIHDAAAGVLDDCRLVQVWRDAERLGADRKSFVVALTLRSTSGTLSGDEATGIIERVVAECGRRTGAVLRG